MTNASNILETGKEELSTQVARYEKRLDKLRNIYERDVKNKNKKIEDFKQQVAKLYKKLSDEVDKVNPPVVESAYLTIHVAWSLGCATAWSRTKKVLLSFQYHPLSSP
ncbi:hypothetical protein ES288_A08G065700v1 [Gossypium darwinii]|uniref:Uncharacterized protein n=1 Tax=Gossypium darwinii TaxID=34276 RepID=A0A5D2FIG0_GOSDA|nr:hypothetical protein ES288_A08G065700v1 [Gossypium darwinii]